MKTGRLEYSVRWTDSAGCEHCRVCATKEEAERFAEEWWMARGVATAVDEARYSLRGDFVTSTIICEFEV